MATSLCILQSPYILPGLVPIGFKDVVLSYISLDSSRYSRMAQVKFVEDSL